MIFIRVKSASLSYPVYNTNSRSMRSHLVSLATGGLAHQSNPRTVLIDALRGISIDLTDGDRVGLIGPNGAGKSTLLRLLAGIYQPDSGLVERKGRIETLFDLSLGMDVDAKGYDNIQLMAAIRGFDRKQTESIMRDVTEFSELGEFLNFPVRTYSSGMMARLGFSIATAVHPEIFLIDEIFGVGDQYFLKKAQSRLKVMAKESNILVLASHSTHMVREFCNKCAIMKRGRIVELGPSDEVLRKYEGEIMS